jgi:magnesium transporter
LLSVAVDTNPNPSRSGVRTAWPAATESSAWSDDLDASEPAALITRVVLYDADGHDGEISLDGALPEITERQLLWVDVEGKIADDPGSVLDALGLPGAIRTLLKSRSARTQFAKSDGYVHLGLPALHFNSADDWRPVWVRFVWCNQLVLTIHQNEIDAFARFREQDRGETQIGALTGAVLCAALLDWHLASYFKAIEALERSVDRFDDSVLGRSAREDLIQDLVRMRRRASRMRRLLSSQRETFHGLTRPDVVEEIGEAASAHFVALGARFERTREALEHATDLVHGSFSLHASRTAESVNDFLKTLTFGTFLLGALGVVAGILGMNFDMPFFATGARGFWLVVAVLATVAIGALTLARSRRWI